MNGGSVSVSATTGFASGGASASAVALTASASGGVNIPGGSVFAGDTKPGEPSGLMEGFFEIVNPIDARSKPVSALLSAALQIGQAIKTGAGSSAGSGLTFKLRLPDIAPDPFLFLDNQFQIGPESQLLSSSSPTLSGTATLQTNMLYSLQVETEVNDYGNEMTPEPGYVFPIGAGLCLLFALRATTVIWFPFRRRRLRRGE